MSTMDDPSSLQTSNVLPVILHEKIKTEPRDVSNEQQEVTCNAAIKQEPKDSLEDERDVKPEVIKTELEDNSKPPEIKRETGDDRNETNQIKSEPNEELEEKPIIFKNEPVDISADEGALKSDLMIESTSSLSVHGTTAGRPSNVAGILETHSQIKVEVEVTTVKEEIADAYLGKIENEGTSIESIGIAGSLREAERVTTASGRPRRTCKRIDYSVLSECGRDENGQQLAHDFKKEGVRRRLKSAPKAMCINPKWRVRNEAKAKYIDGVSVKGAENLAVSKVEVPGDYPILWVNAKEEKQDGVENPEDSEDTDEERNQSDDPDWQIDDLNDGMDLVRNINEMLSSKFMKSQVDVLEPPRVPGMRGRRKRKLLEPDELIKELLDGQVLSSEQSELLEVLRSRMDFSDPATLSYWDGLARHMCLVCAYKTHVPAHMVKHVRCHTGEKPYECPDCDYRCRESSSLATHRRIHTGEKPYACPHCDYRTNGSSILKTHIMIHTGKKPFSCPHCDFKCREHGGLKRHIRVHTGEKPFACPHCDYRGPSSTCLKSHMMVHTREKPHVCSYCGYATGCSSSLTIHLRRHTGEKPYSCSVCKYKFVSSGTLKVHMRTHTGEKPYMCKICDYRCATQGRFKSHLRIHSGDKKHECPFCDYKSVRSDNLKMHLRTHTGERPYPCPHCEYRSSEKARLVQHIRIHTGEKPYVCNVCGFRTSDKNGLRSHSSVHSTDKPFCCSYCDFKTARRGILKTHIMRHTGARPYACPYCPYKSTKSCALKGHVANNHNGNKKFACEVEGCSYRAVIASGLKTHMKTHLKSKQRLNRRKRVNHHGERQTSYSISLSCYECPFNTSSRQKMKTHAAQHLVALRTHNDPPAQLTDSSNAPCT